MAEPMIQKRTLDVLTAFGILGVLATMILPLPTWLLSFLLILNLAMSVTVLLVVLNIREILDFS
ncbi:MAG TPA: FHIPEP family type III secretion protein, partial [Elusimicrobiota bacterium]|nr:FHIPEP family type III secretion protein [Elusimicrobiota bacterium]